MEKPKINENSIERQKYQMHKDGYNNIVNAIKSIPVPTQVMPEIKVDMPDTIILDMSDTNKILNRLIDKMEEPLCVTLKFD